MELRKRKTRLMLALSLVVMVLFLVARVHVFPGSRSNSVLSFTSTPGQTEEKELQPSADTDINTRVGQPNKPPQSWTSAHSSVQRMPPRGQSQARKNPETTSGSKTSMGFQSSLPQDKWGEYPDWWLSAWPRSTVSGSHHQFAGDKPLFPPCTTSHSNSMFSFVKPRKYLENSKNPCWYEQPKAKRGLRCVPFMYLAGVAKCGTSDLARRLRQHFQVFEGTSKEYHWWERFRFGSYDGDDPDMSENNEAMSFGEYVDAITGDEINVLKKELEVSGSSQRIFGDYSPSYLWDPQNWYVLDGNQGCLEPRVIVAQHIYHMYPQAKIILTFRHPTPRLYSRFMSRIHRTSWLKKATVQDFHRYVSQGIQIYKKCFQQWSIRHCAYSFDRYKESAVRLVEGMYPVFMADWLRVWPRDQMHIMRYEDYGGHEGERMQELFQFLGLEPLNKTQMDSVLEIDVVNSGSEEYQKYGSMLPETKKLLDDFYQPFVLQFAEMLNDKRFLWRDVYQ